MRFLGRFARYIDVIFIGFAVGITFYCSTELPWSDDWDIVPTIQMMRTGTLDWKTLDASYGGHKEPVSRLVLAGTAVVTHWNTYVFRIINLFLFISIWMAIRPFAVREGRLLATALIFWSWNQAIMWCFTAQMSETLAIFCVIWSLRALQDQRWRSFGWAMMLAVAGTYCHGAGLGVWPAAFYLMFFRERRPAQRVIFAAILLATAYLYVFHDRGPGQGDELVLGHHYLQMPLYLLLALGAPLGFATYGIAAIVTLGGLAVLLMSKCSKKMKDEPFIKAVFLAGLTMIGLVVVVRGGSGSVVEGMHGRFGTCAALFWVGIVLLADWSGWKQYILAGLLALCVIRNVTRIPSLVSIRSQWKAEAYNLVNDGPVLKGDWTTPEQFAEDLKLMRQWHYSVFRNR